MLILLILISVKLSFGYCIIGLCSDRISMLLPCDINDGAYGVWLIINFEISSRRFAGCCFYTPSFL